MSDFLNRKKVFSGFIWRFLERAGAQGVTFLVSVILARLLDPSVYGTIALVTVFTTILQVFIDSGMGNALIQKKDTDDLDYSSVFYFNLLICVVLYGAMFGFAPLIARFYDKPELTVIVRVLSVTLIISGVKNIQQAYVSKHLMFRKFFFATLIGTVSSAVVGIWMAYNGFGVWAIITQNLLNTTIDTLVLWVSVKWRPLPLFSFSRLKSLFSYGWKLLASSLLEVFYSELRQLIIGKLYTTNDLAFYNKAAQFPKLIVTNINTSIDSVLLPTMASVQDRKDSVRAMTRRAIKTSTYLMMPIMMGLAVCAESIIRLLLTEKWLPSVFFLRIFCFTYAFYPIHTANLNAIKAMGRSDKFLKLEVIKKIVGFVALISTMFVSVKAMAISLLATSIVSQIINSWPNKSLLDYSYPDQIKDILPQIGLSCLMGIIVYSINLFVFNDWARLAIQIPVGVLIYVIGSIILRIDSFNYLSNIIISYIRKK